MSTASTRSREIQRHVEEQFRCPDDFLCCELSEDLSPGHGYFRFGEGIVCYGPCAGGAPASTPSEPLRDVADLVVASPDGLRLPFDPSRVIDNLRRERYTSDRPLTTLTHLARNGYYLVRPLLPVSLRKHIQKLYLRDWESLPFPRWPLDSTVEDIQKRLLLLSMKARGVERVPFIWFWPDRSPSCTILTHDVETAAGVAYCPALMDLNDSFGIKSSFQIVPETRYPVSANFLDSIRGRGFEVNVHDLTHDGHLFRDHKEFLRRAERINRHARAFGARGFRSAIMYRNIDWHEALDVSYDMSIPNVAHLDPQRGGCCTVFPFFAGKILELPVTLIQDYSLFHILRDYTADLWKRQISLLLARHGLVSAIVHPDYILEERPRRVYMELLRHLHELRAQAQTWIALPGEVDTWWRERHAMRLVKAGGGWRIEGRGSERASIASAVLDGDNLVYEF
ncbi:MAG: hypothetical protein ABUS49_01950 [Acidobacteriota bacterium]